MKPSLLLIACLAVSFAAEDEPAVRHRLPSLNSAFPQGAMRGVTLKLDVQGQYLDRTEHVIFHEAGIRGRVLRSEPTRMEIEVNVAADAAWGPHYFRTVSPRGASNVLLFRVGDQPHLTEAEPNSTLETAQRVAIPATINGRLSADGDFDFFRFHAEAGSTWIFDVRAARNGNGLDAGLALLDERGRRLEFCEDYFIWDPFFAHTFRASGDYTAVIQPSSARNDPNFAYQLDIRTAPHLETASPIALAPGRASEVTLFGSGLLDKTARLEFDAPGFGGEILQARGSTATVTIRVPEGAAAGPRHVVLVSAGGRSSPVAFLVDGTPAYTGGDLIRPPLSITGIARYRQPERFSFEAEAGQQLVFEARAQRFGSPVDSVLRILDAKGKMIANNDDATFAGVQFNKDSRLVHKFAEAGRYQVEMRNLYSVTGENFPYQLHVGPPQPAVELMLATDQPYLYPGESGKLKVTVTRKDGFDGEVPLVVAGLPDGVSAAAAVIPGDKNDIEIALKAEGARPGAYGVVTVTSTKAPAPAWRSARIGSGGGEGATSGRIGQAVLAVVEKPKFSLEAQINTVTMARGGKGELPLQIRRAKDFQGEIRFTAENLPAGARIEPIVAGPGESNVTIRFISDPQAPASRSSRVVLRGSDSEGHTQDAPRISVVVD